MELSPIFFSQNNILELHKEIADGLGEGPLGRQAAYSVGFGRSLGVKLENGNEFRFTSVSYTHLRAHETPEHRGCPRVG